MTARSAFAVAAVLLVAAAHACTYNFDRFEQKPDAGEGEPDAAGGDATDEVARDDVSGPQPTPDAAEDVADAGEDAAADADAE